MESQKSDCELDEMTPALSDIEQSNQKKKKKVTFLSYDIREQKRKEVAERIKRQQEKDDCKYKCISSSCLVCMIILIMGCIIIICKYYLDTLEHREDIDNKIVIVSEKWIDYKTPVPHEQVNCTNSNPCKKWQCNYVLEHFHKIPDECEYNDYLVPVSIINIAMFWICICNFIFN